jgi:thiol-disulfide isomerase/thioredoxin
MILFALAEYLSVTEKSYESILKSNHGNFLLIKIWHLWCPRSKEFAPIWEDFKTHDLQIPNLKFGDIECSENPALCARLIGTSYPQVLWFDPQFNVTKRFEKQRTIPNLAEFAREMQAWPFALGKDLEYANSRADPWNPVPLISIPEEGSESALKLLKNVFCKVGKLAVVRWSSGRSLEVLRGSGRRISFVGEWNESELFHWLKRATISQCEPLNQELFEILRERGKPIVHFFIDPKKKVDEFLAFVQGLPEAQYTYSVFEEGDPFVRKFRAKGRKLPVTVWFNPKSEKVVLYDGGFRQQEIAEWIRKAGMISEDQGTLMVALIVSALAVVGVLVVLFSRCRRIKKSAYFGSAGAAKRIGYMR